MKLGGLDECLASRLGWDLVSKLLWNLEADSDRELGKELGWKLEMSRLGWELVSKLLWNLEADSDRELGKELGCKPCSKSDRDLDSDLGKGRPLHP